MWQRLGGPPGGLGYDIRYNFSDLDTWYVTDAYGGVFMSTDNGFTWQPSNTGITAQGGATGDSIPVFSLTVDPHDAQIVWAGTDGTGHIYRSADAGTTWTQRDQGVSVSYPLLSFRGFTVDPGSSDIVYAMGEVKDESKGGTGVWGLGIGGVIFKTTDAGLHWQLLWDGGVPSSLCRYMWIDPRNPQVLYVSTGIFDRGAVGEKDWRTDPDPFGGIGVLKSTDGGLTWDKLGKSRGLEMLYIGSLFMHPTQPDVLLAAAGHLMQGPVLETIMQQGHAPGGVFRTTDGGQIWTHVLPAPPEALMEQMSAVEFCLSDPNIAYAGSNQTIYQSKDAGQTWRTVSRGPLGWGPPGVEVGWPIDLQCDPRNTDRIFANNYNGGNFLSEDGGRTWKNASQGCTGAQVRRVEVDPTDAARVYAAGRSGPWRSDVGGGSWLGLRYPASDYTCIADFSSIVVDPEQSTRILSGSGNAAIQESSDRGLTWHHVWPELEDGALTLSTDASISRMVFAPSDANRVYAGTATGFCLLYHEPCPPAVGVVVSRDAGKTWQLSTDEDVKSLAVINLAVDPSDANLVFAACETGLLKSTDGGTTWAAVTALPTGTRVRAVAISPSGPRVVLAGVDGRYASPGSAAAGVWVSTNGGDTWKASKGLDPNGSLHDIVFDPTDPQVAFCSDHSSGVFRSTDGGLTWQKINTGLRNRAATGLSISSDGQHLYAATDGEGVFRLDLTGFPPTGH